MRDTNFRGSTRRRTASGGVLVALVGLTVGCGASSDASKPASTTPSVGNVATTAPSVSNDVSTTVPTGSVVAANSSPESPATTESSATIVPTSDDFCRVVTKAEAATLLGQAVADGKSTSAEGPLGTQGGCVYLSVTATLPATLVNIGLLGTKITHDQFLAQLATDAPDAVAQAGVGEDAKVVPPGLLTVYDHGTVFFVQIVIEGRSSSTDTLVGVAKTVLDRL
jgi:hypothetical protein